MTPFDYLNTSVKSYQRVSTLHGIGLFALFDFNKHILTFFDDSLKFLLFETEDKPFPFNKSSDSSEDNAPEIVEAEAEVVEEEVVEAEIEVVEEEVVDAEVIAEDSVNEEEPATETNTSEKNTTS